MFVVSVDEKPSQRSRERLVILIRARAFDARDDFFLCRRRRLFFGVPVAATGGGAAAVASGFGFAVGVADPRVGGDV